MAVMRAFAVCALTLLLGGTVLSSGRASAGEAKEVYKKVAPSVVLITDLESFGSGVVLSADGLILTNFHVVDSPLPKEVSAEVIEGGKRVVKQFKDVTVVGVHPKYDAALLRVKAPGVQFQPVNRLSGDVKYETADNCYAIGNPGGIEGQAMRNSITSGVIGAAEREMDGLTYIQVSAAINPGNSGGALCDASGNVIGIVTFKISEKEGMAFAIPCSRIREAEFKSVSERPNNIQKCAELEKIGGKYFDIYRRSRDEEEREAAKVLAFICFSLSLAEAPGAASPYHNVGLVYYEMKKPEQAKCYFEHALTIDPNAPNTYHMLGIIAVQKRDDNGACAYWRKGMECARRSENDTKGAASCADNMAISMISGGKVGQAAYFARWSRSLWDNPARRDVISEILKECKAKLDAKVFDQINGKSNDFSIDDMCKTLNVKFEIAAYTPQAKPAIAVLPQPTANQPATPATPVTPAPPPQPQTEESEADKMFKQCQSWFNMADNCERSGLKPKAREYLQKIVDRYPGSTYAKRAAERLETIKD